MTMSALARTIRGIGRKYLAASESHLPCIFSSQVAYGQGALRSERGLGVLLGGLRCSAHARKVSSNSAKPKANPTTWKVEKAGLQAIHREVKTYKYESRRAEPSSAIEPIIVAQLVDLDSLLVARRIRHRLCHHQRL